MDSATFEAVKRKIAELESDGGKKGVVSKFREAKSFNDRIDKLMGSPSSNYRCQTSKCPKCSYVRLSVCRQIKCVWKDYDSRMKILSDMVDKALLGSKNPQFPSVDLHSATSLFAFSLDQQLRLATYFSQLGVCTCAECIIKAPIAPTIDYRFIGSIKLRIGYICTGLETFPLVGDRCRHNTDRFEVFHYWFADEPTLFKAVGQEGWNDHVINLSGMVDDTTAAANRIAADFIQILINLDNVFDECEELNAILSLHPAPIQVVYRTVLGSTGASYMDYFITDKVAVPLEFASGYSEKLAYMPKGMFVNAEPKDLDHLKMSLDSEERQKGRRKFGLSQSGFVYGVKSHSYQIDPATFACWCEILARVPGSVLWMPAYVDEAQENLNSEAKRHKISPTRLVFATDSKVEDPTNLVDVVLDTPMCNGFGAMASICCGIPIVTLPMESFPSRLTASILTSVGCGELIAKSKFEYVQMAVNLGNKPDLLAEMRAKMREILPNSNLFATDRYFGDLENLYEKMWKWREMGEKPEHLVCGSPCPLPCLL